MSTSPDLEVEELRRQVFDLRVLLHALQERVAVLEAEGESRRFSVMPEPGAASAADRAAGSDSLGVRGDSGVSRAERESVARGIGQFIVRALRGERRGSSGRDNKINLSSKYYLVFRDREGRELKAPVRVETSFASVKAAGVADEKAVFVGVPSLREARIVAAEAGYDLPLSLQERGMDPTTRRRTRTSRGAHFLGGLCHPGERRSPA